MIQITDTSKCCGCNACVQRCPRQCLSMRTDAHGFEYPVADETRCVECHLCETVCPVIHQKPAVTPISVYSAKHCSEAVRLSSSSGGVFSLLAQHIIERNGIVFGARFDSQWNVVHDYVDSVEGLPRLRGSKYLQSNIGDCYVKTERFLKEGRLVLFSGTPCQIAGLNNYLGNDYENLLKVDIVCHGVPSPRVWKEYLTSLNVNDIQSINFRCKDTGWKSYSFKVEGINTTYFSKHSNDKYFKAFLNNLSLRPSCYSCPAKAGRSQSDITLGDFWGIDKCDLDMDDDKGVSLVLINTVKGEATLNRLNAGEFKPMDYDMAVASNPCITQSVHKNNRVKKFWQRFDNEGINGVLEMLEEKPTSKLSLGDILDILKWKIHQLKKR